jgi:hypothetical protein
LPLDLQRPEVSAALTELVRAMRRDLGQSTLGLDMDAMLQNDARNGPQ